MKARTFIIGSSAVLAAFLGGGAAGWLLSRRPADARPPVTRHGDGALVKLLLDERLSERTFDFPVIVRACSGHEVVALGSHPSHGRVVSAIHAAMAETLADLNRADSPVRAVRRINEASRFFEDGILARLNRVDGLRCETPVTRDGEHQRSGYPDLRITDQESGRVFYLDPKLVEAGSEASTFRTFYFEPKTETLKINYDAVHLLVGIEHDGKAQAWTFTGWRLVDLATLKVRLKAEFQASNAELYRKSRLSLPDDVR